MSQKVGYARVSQQDQNTDMQKDFLLEAGCEKIFIEKASGAKDDRPELAKAMEYVRPGDTLIVYKLDRLARSTKKLIEVCETLETKNVELLSIKDNIDTSTPTGKFLFRFMFLIAEFERDIIVERTKNGLAAARARGRVGGRKKKDQKKVQQAIDLYNTQKYTLAEIEELTTVTKSTLYRALDALKK
jgi:DNA invertase Pin-like site-specific DNA recombinase